MLLFVYGTLRRGSGHPMQRVLSRNARWLGAATFRGRLYRVADYPGAVPSDDARDAVRGDVYRLARPRSTLLRLDRYEDCVFGRPGAGAYRRECVTLQLDGVGPVRAWIYLLNGATEESRRIAHGDFLALRRPQPRPRNDDQ